MRQVNAQLDTQLDARADIPTVLVAYAPEGGVAQGVAEAVGRTLRAAGLEAEVRAADEVTRVRPYGGVVLGSDLGCSGWLEGAAELLGSFQETLATKPLWLFAGVQTAAGAGSSAGPLSADLVTLIEATEPLGTETFCSGVNAKGSGAVGDESAVATWALTIAAHLGAKPGGPGAKAVPEPKGA